MQKSNLDVKDLANIKPSENLDDTQKAKLLQKSFSDDKTLKKFVEEINNLMTYQGGNVKGLQQFRDAFVKLYKTPPAGVKQLSLTRKDDFVPVKDMYMTQAGVSISNSISWPICKSKNPTEAIDNLMNTNVLLMKRV